MNNQSAIITAKILKLNIFNKDDLVVGLYYPVNNEVDMLPLWHVLLERKVVCAFPKVVSKNTMHFYSMAEGDLWERGVFGNLEPKSGMLVPPESFDVMLVPLVAFDNSFNRLGYGQGYYDNYLS